MYEKCHKRRTCSFLWDLWVLSLRSCMIVHHWNEVLIYEIMLCVAATTSKLKYSPLFCCFYKAIPHVPHYSLWYEKKNKKVVLHKIWNTAVKPPGRKKKKNVIKTTRRKVVGDSKCRVINTQRKKIKGSCILIVFPVTNVRKNLQNNFRHNLLHQESDCAYNI